MYLISRLLKRLVRSVHKLSYKWKICDSLLSEITLHPSAYSIII